MKKRNRNFLRVILIILAIIIIIIILYSSMFTITKSPRCFLSGGVWKMFSNGCGDSCVKVRETPDNPIGCTLANAFNCDCGPFRCWNYKEQRCELN